MAKAGVSSRVGASAADSAPDNRRALIDAAIETLRIDGFARASARAIAARAGCNQGLVFYYFGSVANLLLAALDAVSADRLARYGAAVERGAVGRRARRRGHDHLPRRPRRGLRQGARRDDRRRVIDARTRSGGSSLASHHGRSSRSDAVDDVIGASPLAPLVPSEEIAYGVVALYLGLEMLSTPRR